MERLYFVVTFNKWNTYFINIFGFIKRRKEEKENKRKEEKEKNKDKK